MAKSAAYEPILSLRAATELAALSRSQQSTVLRLISQVAEQPGQLGDYSLPDGAGREIQQLKLGRWLFCYWPDHAVRELRVTEINDLKV